ncbi:MAG: hypothetical protein VKJ06_04155 [Vampirovibrionales bacterium]|nr:hypothetical protein [Vampirovibrionales bacterium]
MTLNMMHAEAQPPDLQQEDAQAKTQSCDTPLRQASITEPERLQAMLDEVTQELAQLDPQIEAIEAQLATLQTLRQTRQRLLGLKLSLEPLLALHNSDAVLPQSSGYSIQNNYAAPEMHLQQVTRPMPSQQSLGPNGTFVPDEAMRQVEAVLKRKGSLNWELYRAIVLAGGKASTEQIRQYLIEHQIARPHQGEAFEDVSLSDISSRVNYLVRKGAVQSVGNGVFASTFGWV